MDFVRINWRIPKKDAPVEIYPTFIAKTSSDLMIRGGDFYAIWDERKGLWSQSQDDVVDIIDAELDAYRKEHEELKDARVLHMWNADTGMIDKWHKYVQKQLTDNYHALDEKLVFLNSPVNKLDYSSKRLPYALEDGDISAYDELISVLYSPDERHKIEWAIGSVVSGDSRFIQKFLVFYGAAGTGKSTILNIIQQLFDGYYCMFDAKALGSGSDAFALETFKSNPLVAIQHDGDLSRIEDNTRLNSVVSHEEMTVNEKFKSQYTNRFQCMLFMGTNKPVRITDAKSGIIRRLIDVSPTENKLPIKRYRELTEKIKFELGGIAYHCLKVYEQDKYAYEGYVPTSMIGASNDFYNFVEEHFDDYFKADETTLNEAWKAYKAYCEEAKVPYPFSKRVFKEELKNYFTSFFDRYHPTDGQQIRNYYKGFKIERFGFASQPVEDKPIADANWLIMTELNGVSEFDKEYASSLAQYANAEETPLRQWDNVETTLSEIDPSKLHYVRVPENHIVIDFDLKDSDGNKSLEKNLEAASKWPKTYAELSKSGKGIHLHYIYPGDVTTLSRVYDDDIEIKVFTGLSSLRRKLTMCNNLAIESINSGLPMKGAKKVINADAVKSEKGLRTLIIKNLRKEIHGSTKPSVDFIYKILEDAYASGLKYDVTDLRADILTFAARSTHQSKYCTNLVKDMKFKSDDPPEDGVYEKDELVFFDVEVFPNLFIVVWKMAGKDAVKMINPTPSEIEELASFKLVGFYCRKYDNHILYGRMMGCSNEQLYNLSQKIIAGDKNAFFGDAYNLSYTDVYDFCSKKQSLKKWEIELGIHHQELGLPWDMPVDESLWTKVAEYCANDVVATEAVFNKRSEDFTAREILSDISGLSVNDTTNQHTTRIVFGDAKHPQDQFVYTDLSVMFPGYKYEAGKSSYRGEDPGEGGYVYAEPGVHGNVALLDIASMHPTSIEQLNLFGPYTKNFSAIKQARIAIKHRDYEAAGKMFDGKLKKYLTSDDQADALSYALKIAINSVYGLTSAKFDNKFRDPRNVDNIVAKRGALFMINLKHEVQERGFTVAHIKTDSIKIPDATPEIIDFVMKYGEEYGYTFEHEATYDKMFLANDAVYIAKYKSGKHAGEWTATGTQFQVPYVFKTLFSHEPIEFADLCETKTVTTALYLDMNEQLPDVSDKDAELARLLKMKKEWCTSLLAAPEGKLADIELQIKELKREVAAGHDYHFVGKAGSFCPIKPGCGGGVLLREKDGKYSAATGTKGYRWLEAEAVKQSGKEEDIDRSYYAAMVDEAVSTISEYCNFEWFVSDDPYPDETELPWY